MVFSIEYESKSKVTINGTPLRERVIKSSKPITMKAIHREIKNYQKDARERKENYDCVISVLWDHGWRSGQMFDIKTGDIDTYDPNDYYNDDSNKFHYEFGNKLQSKFSMFSIVLIPKGGNKGGSDDYNDCLFNCIYQGLSGINNKQWHTKTKFKKRLGLNRADPVSIELIPTIEDALKVNINVSGDYEYVSEKSNVRVLNLSLKNNHYTLKKNKKINENKHINYRPVVFYRLENDVYQCSIDDKDWTEPIDFIKDKKQYYWHLCKPQSKTKNLSVRDQYNEYMNDYKILLKLSNGFIDLKKTPNASNAMLRLLEFKTKSIHPEELTELETKWHQETQMGALMYAKVGDYSDVKCIDQNGMYAHYMSSVPLIVPIKKGEFTTMNDDDIKEFAKFGIYRAIITSTDESKNKLFRFNYKFNKYTSYDITHARKLGFDIKLIMDGSPNALLYDATTRIYAEKIYGSTLKYLYDLRIKNPNVKFIKKMMLCCWGALVEKNNKTVDTNDSKDLGNDYEIVSINKNKQKIKSSSIVYRKINSPIYVTNHARSGAFITSICRSKIGSFINDNFNIDNIYRIQTDGFITSDDVDETYIGTNLGQFKIEKSGNCRINHVNNIVWT